MPSSFTIHTLNTSYMRSLKKHIYHKKGIKEWKLHLLCSMTKWRNSSCGHQQLALHAAVKHRVGVGGGGCLVTAFTTSIPLDSPFGSIWRMKFMFRLLRATLENLKEGIGNATGSACLEMLESVRQEERCGCIHRSNALRIPLVCQYTLNFCSQWCVNSMRPSIFCKIYFWIPSGHLFSPSVERYLKYPIKISTSNVM